MANNFTNYMPLATLTVISGAPRSSVPEPATLALMGLGIAGIGYRRRKQTKA
jgi:hypothetical protein